MTYMFKRLIWRPFIQSAIVSAILTKILNHNIPDMSIWLQLGIIIPACLIFDLIVELIMIYCFRKRL